MSQSTRSALERLPRPLQVALLAIAYGQPGIAAEGIAYVRAWFQW
jgi:hypothetical protein